MQALLDGTCDISHFPFLIEQVVADTEHIHAGLQRLKTGVPGSQRLLQALHLHVVGDDQGVGKVAAQAADAGGGQRDRVVAVPLPDDGVAEQHRIAEHPGRQRIKQRFLLGMERIRNVHELLMGIHLGAANPGKVFQAKAEARIPRDLARQQRVGCNLPDIGGVSALDLADIGIVGIVIDIDDRREIIMDAELPHLGKAGCQYFPLCFWSEKVAGWAAA